MTTNLSKPQQEGLLTVALMAAFADGANSDVERAELKRVAEAMPGGEINPAALYHRVLMRQVTLADAVTAFSSPEVRHLAYETAVCVCEADDSLKDAEKRFLADLRRELQLDAQVISEFQQQADAVAQAPLAPMQENEIATPPVIPVPSTSEAEADRMILNYSILNGALELLPESLATMAIIPLQMKMVYRIGKGQGYELDRRHITELLAAAGVGLTSQVVEGFARKLLGGLLGKVGGGLGRAAGNQLASSAMTFASTYALGQMAQRYYAGGRTLSGMELKQLFASLSDQAKLLHGRYASEIQNRARGINPAQILNLVRSGRADTALP